jgi:hypothetical protein
MDVTSYVVESNPWQLNSDSMGSSIADGALSYGTWDDGETHYYAEVDMQWLFDTGNTSFLSHFTYECGNDLMIGQVPEPATILLSSLGLLGMAAFLRRKYTKKA